MLSLFGQAVEKHASPDFFPHELQVMSYGFGECGNGCEGNGMNGEVLGVFH